MSLQFQGWPPTRIENDRVVIEGSYITPQQIKTSDYFLALGGLSGCVIGWMAGEAVGTFFGEVVGAVLGTIILATVGRQGYLSFKNPFEVVFTEELIRLRHGKGGWTDFDRKVPHSFDMELHERAAAEEYDDGVARSHTDPQKKGTVERIYRDSYHVFLEHVNGKFNLPDMHGKSNAQLLTNRLKGVDEYMKNFRAQEKKAVDPYAGRRAVGGNKKIETGEDDAEVIEQQVFVPEKKRNDGMERLKRIIILVIGIGLIWSSYDFLMMYNSDLLWNLDWLKRNLLNGPFNEPIYTWYTFKRALGICARLIVGLGLIWWWWKRRKKSNAEPTEKRRILERIGLGYLFPYDNPWHALQLVCIILTVLILIIAGINIIPDLFGSMGDLAQKVIRDNPNWGGLAIYGGSLFLVLFIFIGFILFVGNGKKRETVPPVTKALPIPEVPPVPVLSKRGLRGADGKYVGEEDEHEEEEKKDQRGNRWERKFTNQDDDDFDDENDEDEALNAVEEEEKKAKNLTEDEKRLYEMTPDIKEREHRDPLDVLDKMIGLVSVKKQVTAIMGLILNQRKREKEGLPIHNRSYHMIFTGNPGTGKTTVARIMSEILHEIGVIEKGGVIEVDRSQIVGMWRGHTENKLNAILEKGKGRVVFIDEAYALYHGKSVEDADGMNMINRLNKALEDHRDEIVFILAGYEKEMDQLFKANPGLKSRVPIKIHFPDYEPDELFEIYLHFCNQGHYVLTPDADRKAKYLLEDVYKARGKHFGNGRATRNIFEKTQEKQALRTGFQEEVSREDLITFIEEDIPVIDELNFSRWEDGQK